MNSAERRAIISIGSIFALRMLGLFMIIPVFAVYGKQYTDATPLLIGLAVGVYGLGQAIFQIPFSILADRFARKPIIVVGLLLFVIGGAVAASADNIWQVILGRALAGSGAISAVLMALLADVTREQQRTKAMAAMGLTIGGSITGAFILGPFLTGWVGISGLFWLTSIAGILAIILLVIVPTATRRVAQYTGSPWQQIKTVIAISDINRLHVAVFSLHLTLTALFVILPKQLGVVLGLPVEQQSYLYLPLLLLGFFLAVPLIIIAEKNRKMREVFLAVMMVMTVALAVVAVAGTSAVGLIAGLAVYFIGFNLMEATIPSWLSKRAPLANRATALGLNSSSQFFGAFVGGSVGGLLLSYPYWLGWAVLTGMLALAWCIVRKIASPPYLSSMTVTVPDTSSVQAITDWQQQLESIAGVSEVMVLEQDRIAYLKVDKNGLDEAGRHQLSSLVNQAV